MNHLEWQAETTRMAAKMMAFNLSCVREDKLNWTPVCEGEAQHGSALDIANHCINANYRLMSMLQDAPMPEAVPASANSVDVQKQIIESAEAVAKTIMSLDPMVLSRDFTTPMGTIPGRNLITMPAAHMQYHSGQINSLELLYGDTEFHRLQR